LSSGSTLVLINGRRTAPYGLADDLAYDFVNLNTIPFDAVERIEVLKDGLRRSTARMPSRESSTSSCAATTRAPRFAVPGERRDINDGNNARVSLTAGKGDLAKDGYNVFLNVEAAKQEAIWYRDRKSRAWIGDADVRQWGYG
jgi:iron complex outermembrane receptor protein